MKKIFGTYIRLFSVTFIVYRSPHPAVFRSRFTFEKRYQDCTTCDHVHVLAKYYCIIQPNSTPVRSCCCCCSPPIESPSGTKFDHIFNGRSSSSRSGQGYYLVGCIQLSGDVDTYRYLHACIMYTCIMCTRIMCTCIMQTC